MAMRWPITSTASMAPLVGIRPASDLVEVVSDARDLLGALALHVGVRHGPGAHPAERPAHQIRQRQARGARLGVPPGSLRLAGADLHPHGASRAHDAPLAMWGSEGAQPPASSLRGRAKRGHGGYAGSPPLAASDKPVADVSETRRQPPPMRWRSTPVRVPGNRSTGIPRPGRRRDGHPRCRAVHVPAKPERRLIPASAPVGAHGHQFRRGMDQPELRVSSRVSPRLIVLPFTLR